MGAVIRCPECGHFDAVKYCLTFDDVGGCPRCQGRRCIPFTEDPRYERRGLYVTMEYDEHVHLMRGLRDAHRELERQRFFRSEYSDHVDHFGKILDAVFAPKPLEEDEDETRS